jgi:chromosome segregation ATPase
MEQTQQPPCLQRQSSVATDTKLRLADDSAFNSVRQAALAMFKQRTKDLTRLASVEAQSQKIASELQQVQTSVAQLATQQACLEALVEEEQQRMRQREGCLTELHGALVQVDEEQRAYTKLQQTAEATINAATTFITRFTSSEGRLFQLLALAKTQVGGRAARDLQMALAQTQQRVTEAAAQQQRLLSGPFCFNSTKVTEQTAAERAQVDVVQSFSMELQRWVSQTAAWTGHRELVKPLDVMQQLLEWLATDDSVDLPPQTMGQQTADVLGKAWPPLPGCPTLCVDAATFFSVTEESLQKMVQEHALQSMDALREFSERLTDACDRQNYCLPPNVQARFSTLDTTAVDAAWASLLHQREAWEALEKDAVAAAASAAAAEEARLTARVELQSLTESCAAIENAHRQRALEVESGKEAELLNYAAAWRKGWHTLAAQRTSLLVMQSTIDAKASEAANADRLRAAEAETHAQEMAVRQRVMQEQQETLEAAQKQLEEASAHKSALEEELAAVQRTERDAQQQLEMLLSSLRRSSPETLLDTAEASHPRVVSALQSVAGCPEMYKEWASTMDAQKDHFADTNVAEVIGEAICRAPSGEVTTESASLIRAALQHVAATLQLPTELFQADVLSNDLLRQLPCLTALASEMQSAQVSAETHRACVAEAQAEVHLLRQELFLEE